MPKYAVLIILLQLHFSVAPVFAQVPVRTGPAPAEEIAKARVVVEANMDSMRAHKAFIYAMGIANPAVVTQYREWTKKYPKNITIPLSIGTVFYNAEMAQGKEFLLKAAAIEPNNARIWYMLAEDAFYRGRQDSCNEYTKKASLADPSNANYAYGCLISFKDGDPAVYKQKVFDFVKCFPADEFGAEALYRLGAAATNVNDKITYFEQLRKLYPPQKFTWSAYGMTVLADIYLQTDPGKALALINEMAEEKHRNIKRQVAESLLRVRQLEQEKNYKDADIELDHIRLPVHDELKEFMVLKKASVHAESGDVGLAYDSLAARFAKLPTDRLDSALELYGKELGKDDRQIAKDIETERYDKAVPAYPFALELYTSDGKLNLTDLKGKVVLLTFWFPGCGPCREEFPHFQAVINKFKGREVVYLGIDVTPLQDLYVIPFLANNRFSFIPLRGSSAFAAKYYGVEGEPENFLIDKAGKIIFSDFRIDGSNHRTLELMIASLLQKD